MFSMSSDQTAALVVHYFSGPENSDADYESYCASVAELSKPSFDLRIGVLAFDAHNPMPNASWRKRIADASADMDPNTMFILVSERPIVRCIMTAINWVRPCTFQWSIVKCFDEALDSVAELRPNAVAGIRRLHDDCRRQSQMPPRS
jgi:hypothetical protein